MLVYIQWQKNLGESQFKNCLKQKTQINKQIKNSRENIGWNGDNIWKNHGSMISIMLDMIFSLTFGDWWWA